MRDYQPHKNNPYWLEPSLYKRVLYIVRDYSRMKKKYQEVLNSSPPPSDGLPKGGLPGNPVVAKAEKLDRLYFDLHAIEKALMKVPEDYRHGVMENVESGGWPVDKPAHYKTWLYWRKRFLYFVAENLKLL